MTENPLQTPRLQHWAVDMARHLSRLSKDPSTQVGAVIFDPKRRLVSGGYNGFARGVDDTDDRLLNRDTKYRMIMHAEKNAILFATAPLAGCTMVVTHPCCAQCAALIIQSGMAHVMWPEPTPDMTARWQDDFRAALAQFEEAGVQVWPISKPPKPDVTFTER
jgi:dCMP deaminase